MVTVVLVVLAAVLLILAGMSAYLASYAVHGTRYTLEETWKEEMGKKELRVDTLENYPFEPYEIVSCDGYLLNAQLYRLPEPSRKFMIITHGYTMNRYASLKYVVLFMELGYNCIIYDDRGHGENRPHICTYSLKESKDLMAVIRDTYRRHGEDIFLGLHGESLGCATQTRALENHPPVKFLVNDCGFAEIVPVMQGGLRGMHLPGWMIYPASLACRLMYGYSFPAARPIDSLPGNTIPICFIHGAADDFITPDHCERMYAATKGYREIHLFPGAGHAMSLQSDPKTYYEVVGDFVRKAERGDLTPPGQP